MIGVIAPSSAREIVSEFFELFKTPAELYDDERDYDVILVCGGDVPSTVTCRLLVIYAASETPFDRAQDTEVQTLERTCRAEREEASFIVYRGCATFDTRAVGLREPVSDRSLAYVGEGDGTPYVRVGYDLFAEVDHLLSTGQPPEYAEYPSLERHIELLRDLIVSFGVPVAEIPAAPFGYDVTVCLTHDVDHPSIRLHRWDHTTFGFIYRGLFGSIQRLIQGRLTLTQVIKNIGAVIRLPFIFIGWAKDLWKTFDRYLQIERGLGATYFVITRKGDSGRLHEGAAPSKRAAKYGVSDLRAEIAKLMSQGAEVGVHGIDAWLDADSGRAERRTLAAISKGEEIGIRMHWLYYDSASPRKLDEADYTYDSTVGFNSTVGYRSGTLQVYRPHGSKNLLEVPLHVMDTALFYPSHLNLSFDGAWKTVAPLIDDAVRHGGVLTLNWHDRSIAPERLWEPFYLKVVGELKRREAWFPTMGRAVAWFRTRRSASFERPYSNGTTWRISANAKVPPGDAPKLRLRVHRPGTFKGDFQGWKCKSSQDRIEVELGSSASIALSFDESICRSSGRPAHVCGT